MNANELFKKYWMYGVAAIGLMLVFVVIILVTTRNSVINAGNDKQQTLIRDYKDTTNVLSTCLVNTKTAVGVANAQTTALDKVITDAVRGRYTGSTTAKPGTSGSLFSAIAEAYPDLNGLSKTFGDALIIITGCRKDFYDSQKVLQAEVAGFNSWKTNTWKVRHLGGGNFPSNALLIEVAGKPVKGNAALEQMGRLVVVSEAQTGRDTGVIVNTDPFSTP